MSDYCASQMLKIMFHTSVSLRLIVMCLSLILKKYGSFTWTDYFELFLCNKTNTHFCIEPDQYDFWGADDDTNIRD